ncbi:MAG: peptidoglycan DD-metalloendopeptidase family protein [Deltaproteobacteria bacterium]|nr:peptidoglycan DD-metalloendopeptidase family protein [Deltaproteobacteria bacterium]
MGEDKECKPCDSGWGELKMKQAEGKRLKAKGCKLITQFFVLSLSLTPLAFSLLLLLTVSIPAAEPRKTKSNIVNKEKQLESLKREIVAKKKSLEYNVRKENTVLEQLERLDKRRLQKEEDLAGIETSLAKLKQKTNAVDVHIMELQQERERLAGLLQQRLVAMYKMKKGGVIQPLFSSDSVNDFGRRYKYINKIVEHDAALLKDYNENQLLLEDEKGRLKEFETEMLSLRYEVEQKKGEIEEEKNKKRALLKDIRKKKEMQLAAIREMEDASKELQSFLEKLKNESAGNTISAGIGGFAAMRGHMPMPANGKIISLYGKVEHPKFHTITFNNGIEIEANLGAEVRSVYKGRVAYTGWFRGYGKIMIIDHGDGYYTLFGRLSKILKDVDSVVEKGEVIALVGDTGSMKGPHLYFEVRQKGVPLDPLNWLAYEAENKKVSSKR